jgi:6-phosphogluconate dehydrogenase
MTHGCDIGLIGLGVMGRNWVLNMADHGFSVAVYNRTAEKTREFVEKEVGERKIRSFYTLQEFIGLLKKPRAILIRVEAGVPVGAAIEAMWHIVDPIIARWESIVPDHFPNYETGTWGPEEANRLLERDGRHWITT